MAKRTPRKYNMSLSELAIWAIGQTHTDNNGCLVWQRQIDNYGYASISSKGKRHRVHRLIYEFYKGSIPDEMMVRHLCNNPACINIEHLAIGTNQDNVNDKVVSGRQAKGTRNGNSKFTEELVLKASEMDFKGHSRAEISAATGLTSRQLTNILTGHTWGWLTTR